MKVWLDDERAAPPGWAHVRTVGNVIDLLIAEEPFGGVEAISLDHDLGDGNESGYEVLRWIESEVYHGNLARPPRLHVHTANPPARKRMEAAIAAIEKEAMRQATEQEREEEA
jgi:hypothetical protein